jgi:hypothetical protein
MLKPKTGNNTTKSSKKPIILKGTKASKDIDAVSLTTKRRAALKP